MGIETFLNQTCEHNHFINTRSFDIVCQESKNVIEYDGYYWHRIHNDSTQKEKQDEKLLKKTGYKFLRIRSTGNNLPTEQQLRKVFFNHFEHGYSKWTITLPSWKEAKRKHGKHK